MFDTTNTDACAHELKDFDSDFGIVDVQKRSTSYARKGDDSLRKRYADVRPYAFLPMFRIHG